MPTNDIDAPFESFTTADASDAMSCLTEGLLQSGSCVILHFAIAPNQARFTWEPQQIRLFRKSDQHCSWETRASTSSCNQQSQSAGRERQGSDALHNLSCLSREDVIKDTMLWTRSSVSFAEPCSPCNQPAPGRHT